MGVQPSGTVTLVFTDIEGSTRLLAELGVDAYQRALAGHRERIREAFGRHQGYEVDYEGDAFFYAFQSAGAAVAAVSDATASFAVGPIRVRVGIHTGEPGLDPPKYVGMDVHLAARIMAAAHGGQVVLSQSTRDLLDQMGGTTDLGEHRLKDLAAPIRLYQLGDGEFPPLKTLYRSNLPVPATPFLGRTRELGELIALLEQDEVRLVNLTGPGGTGKTRLALQAAAEAAGRFPDGTWWVPLAPLREPALVLSAVAQALEIKEQPAREWADTLAERLAGKRLLVLLDNVEHLLPEAGDAIAALREIAGPLLLVTSRERLQLEGERVYPVPALDDVDALELFEARARQLGAAVSDKAKGAELCARLDNLPLAIELAAARTPLLSADQLLERLAQRLDLLKGGRDVDPRQQTLRATIEWSYELLNPEEQRVYRALSVFSGGCTLAAAEHVCEASIDTLQSLLDRSLLRRRDTDHEPRYSMLETIRQYAVQQLERADELEQLGRAHAEHFLRVAETVEPKLERGGEQALWLRRLDADAANLIEALRWARASGEGDIELRLATASWRFWHVRGLVGPARQWLEGAIARSDPSLGALRAHAFNRAAFLADRQGDEQAATKLAEHGLALSRELGEQAIAARSLLLLAWGPMRSGDPQRALSLLNESAALARQTGDSWGLANALAGRAMTFMTSRAFDLAAPLFEEAVALMRSIDDLGGTAFHLCNLALVELRRARYEPAKAHVEESLVLSKQLEYREGLAYALELLAYIEIASNSDPIRATQLLGSGQALREQIGSPRWAFLDDLHEDTLTAAGQTLGEKRFSAEWAAGEFMIRNGALFKGLSTP